MIIDYLVPLVSSFFTPSFTWYWFFPLLALAVVVTVPCIIHRLVR